MLRAPDVDASEGGTPPDRDRGNRAGGGGGGGIAGGDAGASTVGRCYGRDGRDQSAWGSAWGAPLRGQPAGRQREALRLRPEPRRCSACSPARQRHRPARATEQRRPTSWRVVGRRVAKLDDSAPAGSADVRRVKTWWRLHPLPVYAQRHACRDPHRQHRRARSLWRGVVRATAVPRTSPAPIQCGRGGGGPSVSLRPSAAELARRSGAASRSRRASRRADSHPARWGSGDHPHRLPWEPTSQHTRSQHRRRHLHQHDARSTGALLRRHSPFSACSLLAAIAFDAAPDLTSVAPIAPVTV